MSNETSITHTEHDPLPAITGADVKAWEYVEQVLSWMASNHCYNYTDAFRHIAATTDMSFAAAKTAYYRAIQNPYVQAQWVDKANARVQAALELVDRGWLEIIRHQMLIAAGHKGGPKESTAAARFIDEIRKELDADVLSETEIQGKHPARALLEGYLRPRKLTRTTIVEEVELDHEESPTVVSDGN